MLIMLVAGAVLYSSCGYALEGRGSFLPDHIMRIGIPTFKNLTTQPGLEELVTAEIYSEFLSRGSFRLSGDTTGVDAVMIGEITSYDLVPRALDEEGVASSYLVVFRANITFRDLVEDKILWEQKNYYFQSEYQLSRAEADFVTQESDSIREAAQDFARSVVSTILTGF